jgi:hypothetical protein
MNTKINNNKVPNVVFNDMKVKLFCFKLNSTINEIINNVVITQNKTLFLNDFKVNNQNQNKYSIGM